MKKPPLGGFFVPSRLVNLMTTARAELCLKLTRWRNASQYEALAISPAFSTPPFTRRSIIVLERVAPQGSRQYNASAFAYPANG
jgi:hypothetical protein